MNAFPDLLGVILAFKTISIVMAEVDRDPVVTDKVWFQLQKGSEKLGKVEIGLFGLIVPRTVNNFIQLAVRRNKGEGYIGSKIHRVVRGFMIQGGDFVNGTGAGGLSIYGPFFPDENFLLDHYGPGWVAMANPAKPDMNSSQFFILTAAEPTTWLNGKHVVFGKVLKGMNIVMKIEGVETTDLDAPTVDVVIVDCGAERLAQPVAAVKEGSNLKY